MMPLGGYRGKYYNILPLGTKYSMHDLISAVDYCLWAVFLQYRSYNASDVTAPLALFRFIELLFSLVNYIFDGTSCKNLFDIHYFSFSDFSLRFGHIYLIFRISKVKAQ